VSLLPNFGLGLAGRGLTGRHLRQGWFRQRQLISSTEFCCSAKANLVSHWHADRAVR
jgi:hypothetical protein